MELHPTTDFGDVGAGVGVQIAERAPDVAHRRCRQRDLLRAEREAGRGVAGLVGGEGGRHGRVVTNVHIVELRLCG